MKWGIFIFVTPHARCK